jgi:hypothetical protein
MLTKPTTLEQGFHEAMLGIYNEASKLKPPYIATRFFQMVTERGGKATADALLATKEPSTGFTELYLRDKRLDLSVEYLVLKQPWRRMFAAEQLAEARKRLVDHKFPGPPEDDS